MRKLLLILALLTIIFGTIYVSGQQIVRQGANESALTVARETVDQLDTGANPESLIQGKVNVASSLQAFVIIYDKAGRPIAGNGYLEDKLGTVPYGVLTHADQGLGNHVTWQPAPHVRIASVSLKSVNGDYVLGGHNLRAVEKLENQVFWLSVLGWGLAVAATLLLYPLPRRAQKAKG